MQAFFKLSLVSSAVLLATAISDPTSAQTASNTALTRYQADQIMNGRCSGGAGYAADAAARRGESRDRYTQWAYRVLMSNFSIPQLQSMIRDAESAGSGGNRDQREIAEFQICILDTKMAYIS